MENLRKTGEAVRQGAAFFVDRPFALADQAAAEADGDRMGPRAGLKLGEQVADVALHRLLAQYSRTPISRFTSPSEINWSTSISRAVGS